MHYRDLGRTGWKVSDISFGAWAIGASWGEVDDSESLAAMHRAIDLGCNFIDTADNYGDGHSEQLIAQLKRERPGEEIIVAPKRVGVCPNKYPKPITRRTSTHLLTEACKISKPIASTSYSYTVHQRQ